MSAPVSENAQVDFSLTVMSTWYRGLGSTLRIFRFCGMRRDWTLRTLETVPFGLDDFLDDLPVDDSSEEVESEDEGESLSSELEDDGVSDSESLSTRRAFLRDFLGFLQAAEPL